MSDHRTGKPAGEARGVSPTGGRSHADSRKRCRDENEVETSGIVSAPTQAAPQAEAASGLSRNSIVPRSPQQALPREEAIDSVNQTLPANKNSPSPEYTDEERQSKEAKRLRSRLNSARSRAKTKQTIAHLRERNYELLKDNEDLARENALLRQRLEVYEPTDTISKLVPGSRAFFEDPSFHAPAQLVGGPTRTAVATGNNYLSEAGTVPSAVSQIGSSGPPLPLPEGGTSVATGNISSFLRQRKSLGLATRSQLEAPKADMNKAAATLAQLTTGLLSGQANDPPAKQPGVSEASGAGNQENALSPQRLTEDRGGSSVIDALASFHSGNTDLGTSRSTLQLVDALRLQLLLQGQASSFPPVLSPAHVLRPGPSRSRGPPAPSDLQEQQTDATLAMLALLQQHPDFGLDRF